MHALLDTESRLARQSQQLDAIAEFLGELDVHRRHAPDAFDMDAGEVDPGAEGRAGQHGELVCGIDTIDVETRIGLGVACGLGLREHDVEVSACLAHRRQDVVAGAVEDAVEALDAIADQALSQRLDDRNAASDCSLERKNAILLLGPCRDLGAMQSEQSLVGGDDVLARRERLLDQPAGNSATATNQFHNDVDIGGRGECQRILLPAHAGEIDIALLGARAGTDGDQLQGTSAAQRKQPAMFGHQLDHAGTDGAETGNAYSERGFHGRLIRQVAARREP